MTQYNKRYILFVFDKIEILASSNMRFNKLSDDTKFVKIEVILLKIQVLQSVNFLLFSLFYTLFGSLSQNKPGRQDVPFVVLGHKYSTSVILAILGVSFYANAKNASISKVLWPKINIQDVYISWIRVKCFLSVNA